MSRRKNKTIRIQVNEHAYYSPLMLPSHILQTDLHYQRKIDMPRVERIVAGFDHGMVNPLRVSHRGGKYFVFDGGHTLSALKLVNKGQQSFPVFCLVYEGLTYEEECLYFAKQRENPKPVAAKEIMNANVEGKDEETLKFVKVTEDAGVSLGIKERRQGQIWAVEKAKTIHDEFGEEIYAETIALIKDTWQLKQESLAANMLGGVACFIRAFGGTYDRDRFIHRLKDAVPKDIQTAARMHKASYQTMDASFATEIAMIYNKGRGKGKLETTVVS